MSPVETAQAGLDSGPVALYRGRAEQRRILIYSHDSFGLGHLRRCSAIAHSLVELGEDVSVLILSGSPIIGSFDFGARVDFIRIPGVIKLRNGDYTALGLHMDIEDTLALRASVIQHAAEVFDPDLFIVDKEPWGLRGEVKPTLAMLKARGVPLILGLRDVMDTPDLLAAEWERKNVRPALERIYDDVWIYGLPQVCDPLQGIALCDEARARMHYTGYLRRHVPHVLPENWERPERPYLLVTPGGGGDGEALVDWVLRAYESGAQLPWNAEIVFGPFMNSDRQAEFMARAAPTGRVQCRSFHPQMEALIHDAEGVVAMGGYNTFCEILSFDKRALLVPREVPRMEQALRAERAEALGLVRMLLDEEGSATEDMVAALQALPAQPLPSSAAVPGLLGGLPAVNALAQQWLDRHKHARAALRPDRAAAL